MASETGSSKRPGTSRGFRAALCIGALAALVVLGIGGGGGSSVAEAVDPPALEQYRPKAAGAVIKAASLSASDRDSFDPKRVGTEFREGVTHVVVWYRWEGAKSGHRVDIHWSLEGSRVLEQGEAIKKAAGTEAWVLKTTGGPLPAGNYRVELLENGKAVTTIPFRIGGTGAAVAMLDQYKPKAAGAVIKAVSLSASNTDDFDSKRVGTEFPAGVPRVVVYYLWEGAKPGLRLDGRWFQGDSLVAEKQLTLTTETGFGDFSIGPLPVGNYRVDLLENGKVVTTIPFRIR